MNRVLLALSFLLAGCTTAGRWSAPLPPQARYVAMGSSFAAGPGVTTAADTPATRCARSADNYAHQLARRRDLALIDVSCSGATSEHLIGAWRELPPQIDALTPDTRLVTVTIGGNDVGYVGGLMAAVCPAGKACRPFPQPTEAAWAGLETRLEEFVDAVAQRAPRARLIFVNYVTLLPPRGACAASAIPAVEADKARSLADRLARLTAASAARHGADLLDAAALSRAHDPCAPIPWATGAARTDGVPFHPNLAGMTAIADALDRTLQINHHRRTS